MSVYMAIKISMNLLDENLFCRVHTNPIKVSILLLDENLLVYTQDFCFSIISKMLGIIYISVSITARVHTILEFYANFYANFI